MNLMKSILRSTGTALLVCSISVLAACGDDDDADDTPPPEVITTFNLTLMSGSDTITASLRDADGDGGDEAVQTDPSPLMAGETYAMSIELLNELEGAEDPDITAEIRAEAEEHQFFYEVAGDIGTVMITDVESDYAMNMEGEDLPVGLAATFTATTSMSTGTLSITLKHLPPDQRHGSKDRHQHRERRRNGY